MSRPQGNEARDVRLAVAAFAQAMEQQIRRDEALHGRVEEEDADDADRLDSLMEAVAHVAALLGHNENDWLVMAARAWRNLAPEATIGFMGSPATFTADAAMVGVRALLLAVAFTAEEQG